jgi:rod shape-determining protein MreC
VVGVLVVLALALVTASFRESEGGPLHGAQSALASVLRPFEIGAERVARPFRDAWGWTNDLFSAKSDAEQLRAEVEELRQQVIQNESALQENVRLKALMRYIDGPSFPTDYRAVATAVINRPAGAFEQEIVVAAGTDQGVRLNAPVVTADGLVGQVTRVTADAARVTLITDERSAVSALDLRTGAAGIVRHGQGTGDTLVLDLVPKEDVVKVGHEVVTAGWKLGSLASLYPKGIPIGEVTSVGQTDTDLWKQVQIRPYVDFGSLHSVLVLVPTRELPELP